MARVHVPPLMGHSLAGVPMAFDSGAVTSSGCRSVSRRMVGAATAERD